MAAKMSSRSPPGLCLGSFDEILSPRFHGVLLIRFPAPPQQRNTAADWLVTRAPLRQKPTLRLQIATGRTNDFKSRRAILRYGRPTERRVFQNSLNSDLMSGSPSLQRKRLSWQFSCIEGSRSVETRTPLARLKRGWSLSNCPARRSGVDQQRG